MQLSSIKEFAALTGAAALRPVEHALIKACRAGEPLRLGDLPGEGRPSRKRGIRADLIRLLITGGTPACRLHPVGIWLEGAQITGTLDLRFANGRGRVALIKCRFAEKPLLEQARLALLSLDGSALPGLFAQGIEVEGSVVLRGVTATGIVDVNGARIGGQLVCVGARLNGGTGKALFAQGAKIGAGLFLSGVTATDTVDVNGARIGGPLDFEGAALNGGTGNALNAQGAKIGASLFLRGVTATGMVDVNGAWISGQLVCDGATLNGGTGKALNAQAAEIGASLFLRGVTVTGTVDVNDARIGGQLDCDGATLDGGTGKALNAQGAEIGASLFLTGVTATGMVDLAGARIGGQLACIGAKLDGGMGMALFAQRLKVTQGFLFRDLRSVTGQINLDAAHVSDLYDDAVSWPAGPDQLSLHGFTYDRIGEHAPLTFAARRDWLERGSRLDGAFHPQPYTQFARVLREAGHEAEARLVLRERERLLARDRLARDRATLAGDQTRRADAGPIWLRMQGARAWSWLTGSIAGYGYAPGLALVWSFALICLATIVYAISWDAGLMVPNSAIILTSADWSAAFDKDELAPALHWTGQAARHYETFYAIPYAIDVYLPVVDLGQHSAWTLTTATTAGALIRVFTWALQVSGYIVTGLGLAAATGLIQRDKD